MKKISEKEYKEILYDILKEFDRFCRKNKIDYSLIGGSLIGAIREKAIIPWDDDVDVIMTPKNYNKFKKLYKDSEDYILRYNSKEYPKFPFPFMKLINAHTTAKEKAITDTIEEYGIYIDIFKYCNTYNDPKRQKMHHKIINFTRRMRMRPQGEIKGIKKRVRVTGKRIVRFFIGQKNVYRAYDKLCSISTQTDYMISNWPIYPVKKEIQKRKDIEAGYIDTNFGPITAMVFKNYDNILKTTFGDYMTPPPANKQTPKHSIEAYWKDEYESNKEKN